MDAVSLDSAGALVRVAAANGTHTHLEIRL